MKKAALILLLVFFSGALVAQRIYFIYLQTETGEPFFVRINDKLYSSTTSGYLIIPRLIDSTYNFKLGFPGKNIDLDFSASVNKKDHGYLVKNFDEKGWGLFDLQSLSIQMSLSNAKNTSLINNSSATGVNAFTDLLSKAADDPSLKQNPVLVKEEEKKPQAVEAIVKEEKKPEITETVVKEEKKPESNTQSIAKPEEKKPEAINTNEQKVAESAEKNVVVQKENIYKKSVVTKISGTATTEGFESMFIDQFQDGSKDTIRILIPGDKETVIIKGDVKPENKQEDKKFLDIISDTTRVINKPQPEIKKEEAKKWRPFNKNKAVDAHKSQPETKKEESKKWGLFSNKNKNVVTETKKCQVVADNDDFLKLRRKMAAKTNDGGMIDEAKKYFKTKCFTTEQIKNLSSMFLSNAGKYNFFEAAHNYISDTEKFSSLQSELNDEYYANRFKAMLGN